MTHIHYWCIKVDGNIISSTLKKYINDHKLNPYEWDCDLKNYFYFIDDGKIRNSQSIPSRYTELSFDEFKENILKEKPQEPNYEIY